MGWWGGRLGGIWGYSPNSREVAVGRCVVVVLDLGLRDFPRVVLLAAFASGAVD